MSTNVDNGGFGKNWDDKLRLLDAIDSMRGPAQTHSPQSVVEEKNVSDMGVLQEKLRVYEQTCAMLEREVQVLEQQTLVALAETGRLRRELDRSEAEKRRSATLDGYIERESFDRIILESENERRLLLDALENSEAELARMVKTLDMVARKLQVA